MNTRQCLSSNRYLKVGVILCATLFFAPVMAQVSVPADGLLDEIEQESRNKARAVREQKTRDVQVQQQAQEQSEMSERQEMNARTQVWISTGVSNVKLGSAPTQEIGFRLANSNKGFSFTAIVNNQATGISTGLFISCDNSSVPYLSTGNYRYSSNSTCFRSLGERRVVNTFGMDFKLFSGDKSALFQPYLGIGAYISETILVAQSKQSGLKYAQADANYYKSGDTSKITIDGNLEVGALIRLGRLLVGGSIGTIKQQATIGYSF